MRTALLSVLALLLATQLVEAEQWVQSRTEHFRFIYRPADEWALSELTSFADEVYEEVTALLGTRPGPVNAVLYGETDLANGFYTPAPPQHIALYLRPPTLPITGARTESWLRLLLIHELTHYVQANYSPGIFHGIGGVFGNSIAGLSIGLTPLWFIEGLAIYAETELSSGGRGRDPFFEMYYKAPVIEGRLFSLAQAGYDSYLSPPGRFYPAGYLVWEHLVREEGEAFAAEVMPSIARWPFFGVRGPIREASGRSLPDHFFVAASALEARYASIPRDRAPQITPEGRADYYLPRSAGGRLYVYRSRADALPAIVALDHKTGTESVILEVRLTDHASWSISADGTRIAFATIDVDRRNVDQPRILSNIYVHDTASGLTRQVTASGGYYQPALAPSGDWFLAVRRYNSSSELVRMEIDDELSETTVYARRGTRVMTPTISPSGESFAVIANTAGNQRLVVGTLTEEGRDHTTAVEYQGSLDGFPYFPVFSSEEGIHLVMDTNGQLSLYEMDLSEQAYRLAGTDPVGIIGGTVHGDSVVFSSYTSDGHVLRMSERPLRAPGVPIEVNRGSELAATPGASPPPAAGPTTALVSAVPYRSVPAPRIWIPSVQLASSGLDPAGIGVGALVYGADYLGRSQVQLTSHFFPSVNSFSYEAIAVAARGPFSVLLSHASPLAIAPGTEPEVSRLFVTRARTSLSLLDHFRMGTSRSLSLSLLGDAIAGNQLDLNTGAGLGYRRGKTAALRSVFAPGARSLSSTLLFPLSGPDYRLEGFRAIGTGIITAGREGGFSIALSQAVSAASNPYLFARYNLSGFSSTSDWLPDDAQFAFRTRAEIATSRLLTDVPLLPNAGITEQWFSLIVETTGAASEDAVAFEPNLLLALESTTTMVMLAELPISVGVRARLPLDGGSLDPAEDLQFYLQSNLLGAIPDLP